MGSNEEVSSPTFTISRQYRAKNLWLHHYDFYRLTEGGVVENELAESLADEKNVVAIEWSQVVSKSLPTERMTIKISSPQTNKRHLTLNYPTAKKYMLAGII